jgi:hypothetical protein
MIRQSILRYLCVAAVFTVAFTQAATAQDLTVFQRVLVPISVGKVPGAYGSVWSTELWSRNNSTRPVAIFPLAVSDWVPVIGRTEFLPIGNMPASAPGQILYMSRDGGDEVQFDLRLFNRAAPEASWGTKLPVVREGEFAGVVSLINVPAGAQFRSALRIYGLPDESLTGETVLVQIYSYDERLLASTEMAFEGTPRYAVILSLAEAFPEIRQVDRLRIHIESRSGRSKVWAFVSVTSNATQEIALVTP